MKRMRRLLAAVMVLAALAACIPAASAAGKTVTVRTAAELINALDNVTDNTTINLTANEYQIGETSLYLENVNNVTLKGNGSTKILSSDSLDPVFYILYSDDCTLEGLVIGHDPRLVSEGGCISGVIHMENCMGTEIRNCELFGCGWIGLDVFNSTFGLRNSVIRNCAKSAIEVSNVDSYIENCKIYGNGGSDPESPLIIGGCTLNNCTIYNNKNRILSGMDTGTELSPEITNCTYYGNAWGGDNTAFYDIAPDNWAQADVAKAAEMGFVNGVGDGAFNPSGKITYAELSNMMVKAFFPTEYAANSGNANPWYRPAIQVVSSHNLYSGTGFSASNPTAVISRKDMAMFLVNLIKAVDPAKMPQNTQSARIPDISGLNGCTSEKWVNGI